MGPAIEAAGIPVLRLRMRHPADASVVPRLARALRELGPDLLHTHLVHANALGRVAGRLAGIARIRSTIHTLEGPPWHWAAERLTAPLADEIEFVSRAAARHAARRAGLRGEVCYPGVPVPAHPPRPLRRPLEVVTAMRLVPGKGVDDLIEAMARVGRSDVRLRILGEGPDRGRLEDLAKRRGVPVEFEGWVDHAGEEMDGAAAAVFASRLGEGLQLGPVEAAMRGVPVIAAAVGGTPEAAEPGALVAPGDVEALAGRIRGILEDPEAARREAGPARDRALERFALPAAVERYQRACEGPSLVS